jgi:hypothetical protein
VLKNKNFEFSHNLKWYIIRISFERVLRDIQKNLLITATQIFLLTRKQFADNSVNSQNVVSLVVSGLSLPITLLIGEAKTTIYHSSAVSTKLKIWLPFISLGGPEKGPDVFKRWLIGKGSQS